MLLFQTLIEELEELIEQFPNLSNTDTSRLDKEDSSNINDIEILFFNKLDEILLANKFPIKSTSEELKRTQYYCKTNTL